MRRRCSAPGLSCVASAMCTGRSIDPLITSIDVYTSYKPFLLCPALPCPAVFEWPVDFDRLVYHPSFSLPCLPCPAPRCPALSCPGSLIDRYIALPSHIQPCPALLCPAWIDRLFTRSFRVPLSSCPVLGSRGSAMFTLSLASPAPTPTRTPTPAPAAGIGGSAVAEAAAAADDLSLNAKVSKRGVHTAREIGH